MVSEASFRNCCSECTYGYFHSMEPRVLTLTGDAVAEHTHNDSIRRPFLVILTFAPSYAQDLLS